MHLIGSICDVNVNTANKKKLIVFAKVIELIYHCLNSRTILPNHQIDNLLCYSLTNCKSYLNYIASRSPGGGYTYIANWLKQQCKQPNPFPTGLVKAVFDNNQKVGKTYLISETNVVPTSVITSNLSIVLDPNSTIQENSRLKPDNWMWNILDEEFKEKMFKIMTEPSDKFRETRDLLIGKCINYVVRQHKLTTHDIIDSILTEQQELDNQKRCVECGCEADVSYRTCRNCEGKVTKETFSFPTLAEETFDPYESFSEYTSNLPEVHCQVGEPDFVNPNSYDNIIQVVQAIGTRAGVKQYGGGKREWLLMECDGLPYNLIRDIITNVWRCPQCSSCYYGLEFFQDHMCHVLKNVKPEQEFGWLVPVSGLLHLEINIARSFMKLNWDVFTGDLGRILGFVSPKAQDYLKKGADHHKAWHFFEILYTSLSLELVVPYVRECFELGQRPSCIGYWKWCQELADPYYIYLQQCVLTYLHAMVMLRAGIIRFIIEIHFVLGFIHKSQSSWLCVPYNRNQL